MEKPIHILFVGQDASLPEEVRSSISNLGPWRVYPHFASSYMEAMEVARDRQPSLICFYSNGQDLDWRLFVRDVRGILPEVALVVLYDVDLFNLQIAENGLIIDMLRENIRDFLRRPLAGPEFRQLLNRLFLSSPQRSNRNGTVVSVISNKGGVGKSTVSVNIAAELAKRHPGKVLLIDASLQLGICAMMLDLPTTPTMLDAIRARERLDESLLRQLTLAHSSGLHLLAAPIDAVQAAEIDDAGFARILNLARRAFDYVIVDTFPMVDRIVVSTLDMSDLVYVLLQGTVPNVVGLSRFLPVIDGIGVPQHRQRVILNLNHAKVASELTASDIEARIGRRVDWVLPYTKGILRALNAGIPYVSDAFRLFGFAQRIAKIADEVDAVRADSTAVPLSLPAANPVSSGIAVGAAAGGRK